MDTDNYCSLNNLPVGENATVKSIISEGIERRRMIDLGLINGTHISAVQKSPCGSTTAYFFRGTVIALRDSDARKIIIQH
ncbi:MAG: ferrous iron transport protein A [Acutalibacteraceae bacterium]